MKKILLLMFALLVVGGAKVDAKELVVDLAAVSAVDGNASWDASTHKFAWTGTWSNAMQLPGVSSNMSEYTAVNWTATAGTMNHFRILIYYTNGTAQTTYNPGTDMTGSKSVTFADMGVVATNLAFISSIKISGASDGTGDIVISSFSFTGPDVVPVEATPIYKAPAGTTNMQDLTGTYPTEGANTWKAKTVYPKELAVQGDAFGNGDGGSESSHVSIEGYDYISLVVTEAQSTSVALRVWIWDDVNKAVVTLYAYPEADYADVEDWKAEHRISAPGTYVVKVSGYKHLKGIKAENNWGAPSVTVSYAYVSTGSAPVPYQSTGEYTIVGKDNTGSASLTAALADATATSYDATGVTGTGIELTPANPNALFIANEGVLDNANNVIVEGVCDNLVLADGYPFEAPADFKATIASYSTTINADAKAGTLCLPFEADIPVGVTAYTLKYISGENAAEASEVTGTIPANTPVLLNGAGDATFVAEDADVDADADNTFEALTGVFARTQVPDGSYVLQNGDDGIGFYVVEPTAAIWARPFRAYMTALSNNAKIRVINADGEATGITGKEAPAAAKDGAIYTVAGQRVAKPTKGFYLQDGKTYYAK